MLNISEDQIWPPGYHFEISELSDSLSRTSALHSETVFPVTSEVSLLQKNIGAVNWETGC